ncbi:MAG TPA: chemotaxis protein CheW [Gemmatimonadaceae bacterium]|nr:chemotaxis protein CheW [Gemmatimonadaceae bacterium]
MRIGPERFALPLDAVEEALDAPETYRPPELDERCLGLLHWRGRHVPLCSPEPALGRAAAPTPGAALVLADAAEPLAVAIDDALDVVTLPAERILALRGLRDPYGVVTGMARLDDGLVALVGAAPLRAALRGQAAAPSRADG